MTIIVMGELEAESGEVDRLEDALATMMAATNAEAGCEHYSFARLIGAPDTIIVSERWSSAEALAAHSASPHMAAFNRAVGGARLKRISVKAWDGTFWRTLIGD
jgi:quinol monooxygenase YgiN